MPENSISDIGPGAFEGSFLYCIFYQDFVFILQCFCYSGMERLDHLSLNSNEMSHLKGGMFRGMPNLRVLYIDHNQISKIDDDAFEGLEGNL